MNEKKTDQWSQIESDAWAAVIDNNGLLLEEPILLKYNSTSMKWENRPYSIYTSAVGQTKLNGGGTLFVSCDRDQVLCWIQGAQSVISLVCKNLHGIIKNH